MPAICKWENNQTEPRASNIKILCDYFEVSSDYLLGLENEIGTKKYYTPTQKETTKKILWTSFLPMTKNYNTIP